MVNSESEEGLPRKRSSSCALTCLVASIPIVSPTVGHAESAVLSFDCGLGERRGEFPVSVSCIGQVDDKEKLPELLEFSFDLWEHFRPAYGMSAFASDWSAVSAELTAIPHVFWRGPKDANNEARLLGIQRLHAAFGVHARDAAWGNYLGGPLVERLGGSGAASREAPVAVIRELRDGGLYLQADTDPLLLENDGYTSSLATLNEYLGRIRATKTRDASGWSSPAP